VYLQLKDVALTAADEAEIADNLTRVMQTLIAK
jgi:hypothetical protein